MERVFLLACTVSKSVNNNNSTKMEIIHIDRCLCSGSTNICMREAERVHVRLWV